ncbi:utp11 protein [Apiospora arundinis]|uniref:U3 small nucleolar RNA-associated protein 11 n=1 Tax=Apiospora arundinis TaxID=335852 RepID=A0ABR2HS13_9PEZI
MSSMRNAVQRRNHKERSQPADRKRFGLLEKHKDYSLRAKDFNKKKSQLKSLKKKVEEKNEDEFYHGMISRAGPSTWASKGKRWTGTVDGDRGNKALPMDVVRLMKTQDMGYLRTMRNVAGKDVRALEERVIGMGGSLEPPRAADDDEDDEWEDEDDESSKKPKKIVFADAVSDREDKILAEMEKEEAAQKKLDEKDTPSDDDEVNPQTLRAEQRQRMLLKLHRRLQVARKKLKTLSTAENELELQRARMAKTATIGGTTKSGKKFKVRERKR